MADYSPVVPLSRTGPHLAPPFPHVPSRSTPRARPGRWRFPQIVRAVRSLSPKMVDVPDLPAVTARSKISGLHEEEVARAISASEIPIISGGHETDSPLPISSGLRASTPPPPRARRATRANFDKHIATCAAPSSSNILIHSRFSTVCARERPPARLRPPRSPASQRQRADELTSPPRPRPARNIRHSRLRSPRHMRIVSFDFRMKIRRSPGASKRSTDWPASSERMLRARTRAPGPLRLTRDLPKTQPPPPP